MSIVVDEIKEAMVRIWKRKARYIVVKMIDNYGSTELEKEGARTETFDDMVAHIE